MCRLLRTLLLEHALAALAFSLEYDFNIMSIPTHVIGFSLLVFHKLSQSGRVKENIAEDQLLQVAEACLGQTCGNVHMNPTQKGLDVAIDTSQSLQFEGLDAVHISNGTIHPFKPCSVL